MQQKLRQLLDSKMFEYSIVALILINAVVLGLETVPEIVSLYGGQLEFANKAILAVFIIEALTKITAVAPRINRYFGDGWNLFDFTIVVLSLIPATGQFAMIARLARLLRVARLISTIPEMRLIVSTLVRSIPSMGHVILLMSVFFYIYAVAGYHMFHEHDPVHWRNLGISLLTLFRIVTLEDWTDVMYKAMELAPIAWAFFVSFVVIGTFVVINLFIAVVLNNLDKAKSEQLEEFHDKLEHGSLLGQLKETQDSLDRLKQQLHASSPN